MAGPIQIVGGYAPAQKRHHRRPAHTFNVRAIPFVLQPFMIAPVLPGETLDHLLLQSRCVSDPIINPLIGWWLEHFIFYVKHRDLLERDEFVKMMLDPTWTAAAVDTPSASAYHYFYGDANSLPINWSAKCLEVVAEHYFRSDGENALSHSIDSGKLVAAIVGRNWTDSLINDDDYRSEDVTISTAGDNAFTMSELQDAQYRWDLLSQQGLVKQTYQEFLETYGVHAETEDPHKPELVRFNREWQYPSNTVEPTTGVPTSALSYSVAMRADKKRFFKEPGFLFGVTLCRPKIYMSGQRGYLAAWMNRAMDWMPAALWGQLRSSMHKVAATFGPVNATDDYWFDIRDLLMYGDQFMTHPVSPTNMLAIPTATLAREYPASLAEVQALFVTGATKYFIRQDGVCNLSILTQQIDPSPTTVYGTGLGDA